VTRRPSQSNRIVSFSHHLLLKRSRRRQDRTGHFPSSAKTSLTLHNLGIRPSCSNTISPSFSCLKDTHTFTVRFSPSGLKLFQGYWGPICSTWLRYHPTMSSPTFTHHHCTHSWQRYHTSPRTLISMCVHPPSLCFLHPPLSIMRSYFVFPSLNTAYVFPHFPFS
jgi:hypothetical protein